MGGARSQRHFTTNLSPLLCAAVAMERIVEKAREWGESSSKELRVCNVNEEERKITFGVLRTTFYVIVPEKPGEDEWVSHNSLVCEW